MCFSKYKASQFLEKETDIVTALSLHLDAPYLLEFLLLYFRLLKFYVQELLQSEISSSTAEYLDLSESLASQYLKAILVDVSMMAVKPSIIAATAVIFGLYAAYHLKEKKAKAK